MNRHHRDILDEIESNSGTPTQHTFLDSYLGNSHPRYAINNPTMRDIAKHWMSSHRDISTKDFAALLTSLVKGKSSNEKMMAGFLLDYTKKNQRDLDPKIFESWIDHLVGWVEIDTLCTSKYTIAILDDVPHWIPVLERLSKSKNINKRRASLAFLIRPTSKSNDQALAKVAFKNIDRLKSEKEGIITKAISWLLRSMIKYHRTAVEEYLDMNEESLPAIAVRETKTKLRTGTKSGKSSRDS